MSQVSSYHKKLRADNKTGYKGVYKRGKTFISQVRYCGVIVHSARFCTALDAAKDYDYFVRLYQGEFASLNFPKEGEQSAAN